MGEYAIGQPVPRFEDPRLIQGGGRYVDDYSLPGMVYGVVLRAKHAHAKIRSLDVSKAKAAPGVLAVLTHADWVASGWADLPRPKGRKKRDGSPFYRPALPGLTGDKSRWIGDYIAFVVAETREQGLDALELISVDYEVLPPVLSGLAALEPGAPAVWEDNPDNICYVHLEGNKDKTDAAFANAAHVIKHRFVINRVYAATMEPRGCVGVYDKADDRFTIYTTLQRALNFRQELAGSLKVPESKLRVVAGDIGGSFGMKSGVFNEVALCLLGAKLVGRPVKWTSSRSEAFLSDAMARDNVTDGELALDANGKFLGLRVKTVANLGAYIQTGSEGGPISNLGTLAGPYVLPAAHVDVTTTFSNTHWMRPYRGNGRPEAAYVIERLVDLAADELKMDPAEIRRRNMIPAGAFPYQTALSFKYDCGEFEKCLDLALEMGDWAGFEARRQAARSQGKLRGIGLSYSIEKAASPGIEGAEVRFDRTGSLTIISGAVTHGQGHETMFKQMVADRLGIDPNEITYAQGDTDVVFFGEGTGGSRTSALGGSAMYMAIEKIVEKGRLLARHLMKVDDVEFAEGVFTSRSSNASMTMKEIAKAAAKFENLPEGMEPGLIANAVYSSKTQNYPNGCHVVELEIDEETGTVDFIRYSVVDDVGNVLNPLLLKGQIHGGIAQGIGQMLMEDLKYDPQSGELLTGSFMDYAMPHADNMCNFEVKSHPVPTSSNLLGVKGAGEAGCVGALPAVANALADALSHLGIKDVPMPATPQVLWRLIHEAKHS
ncbi:MAG: xanthine dehydrogenase family protein molybdopterin-binding subunit [Alphaproteobacteria bacterium]|nr:xanthine dehydrogenase family protein molybdopterin-binding subunit [Alphaproteobacteria bacterium]